MRDKHLCVYFFHILSICINGEQSYFIVLLFYPRWVSFLGLGFLVYKECRYESLLACLSAEVLHNSEKSMKVKECFDTDMVFLTKPPAGHAIFQPWCKSNLFFYSRSPVVKVCKVLTYVGLDFLNSVNNVIVPCFIPFSCNGKLIVNFTLFDLLSQ